MRAVERGGGLGFLRLGGRERGGGAADLFLQEEELVEVDGGQAAEQGERLRSDSRLRLSRATRSFSRVRLACERRIVASAFSRSSSARLYSSKSSFVRG